MSKSFTPEDVAALSGKASTTVMSWIRTKKLKAKRIKSYSIQGSDLRDFLLKQATVAGRRKAKS
jgi:hypothetical protein